MTEQTWEERYQAVIAEKFTASEARLLRDVIREDPEAFLAALEVFIDLSEDAAESATKTNLAWMERMRQDGDADE